MTPDTFRNWRKRLALKQRQAAEALGISLSLYQKFESGERVCERDKLYGLAMAAILYGLPPYR